MLIRQRGTFADEFLLRVVFPYLYSTGVGRRLARGGIWNHEIRLGQSAAQPARRRRGALRRLTSALSTTTVEASAQ